MTGELAPHHRRLHGLSDTMRAFAEATTDYQRLLVTVAECLAKLVGDGCVVALVSEDEQSLFARGPGPRSVGQHADEQPVIN